MPIYMKEDFSLEKRQFFIKTNCPILWQKKTHKKEKQTTK